MTCSMTMTMSDGPSILGRADVISVLRPSNRRTSP